MMAKPLRSRPQGSNSHLAGAAKFFVGITVVSVLMVVLGPRLSLGARRLTEEIISYQEVLSSLDAQSQSEGDPVHTTSHHSSHQGVNAITEEGKEGDGVVKKEATNGWGNSKDELDEQPARKKTAGAGATEGGSIHVIVTSNGSPYLNWQTRIMYHSFKKVASTPGSAMHHFTRVLHRSSDDVLMGEIPTVRVEPLDPSCDVWCEYPVASRPSAILQWLESGDPKGDWVLMAETDHLFVKPFAVPASGRNVGFPFSYMAPQAGELRSYMKRLYDCADCSVSDIPPTGNAPLLMKIEDMRKVIPLWVDVTAQIEEDEDAKKKLGWVREMYAFSIAVAKAKVDLDLPKNPRGIMVQPPEDEVLGEARIIHYTWGNFIKDERGNDVWSWDKRDFVAPGLPPRIKEPPADLATEVQSAWIATMNEAIDSIPRYCQGELDAMSPEERAAAEEAGGRVGVT
ncbi:hypothetical protein KFL_001240160 [Klebsormidium nitens]|uniref:Hydroxyproline O-arabinosyltransferase-like domain-containing protein n=1 Tax=Klebsormidium nitens TaxID=105231 RepID=A0A1Y1HVY7_KLENI|nr:hypothetical protein KFL_001240160 [Klebsormidium nitens]|eukprot:GAQ82785.1 hypothetical protein KFL_001240160 [Klebsormidium nitens]